MTRGGPETYAARVRFARELTEAFPMARVELRMEDDGILVAIPADGAPSILFPGDTLTFRRFNDEGDAVASLTFTFDNPEDLKRERKDA